MPTVTLQPVEARTIDTDITEGSSSDRSTVNRMTVGWNSSSKESRALLEFDLSQALPKSVSSTGISSVTLTLMHKTQFNFSSSQTKTYQLQVIDGAFEEDANWTYRDGDTTSWSTAGGDFLVGLGAHSHVYTGQTDLVVTSSDPSSGTILSHVRDAISTKGMKYRLAIVQQSGGANRYTTFWSSNADSASDYPKLEITYAGVPGIGFKTVTSRLSSLKRRKRAGRKK